MSNITRYIITAAAIIGVVIAVVIYSRYSPLETPIFPRCVFRSITGLECPGCGSQRAIHELLNLNIGAAFCYNPLVVLAIPYIIVGGVVDLRMRRRRDDRATLWLREKVYGRSAILVIIFIITTFTIIRNII